MRLSGSKTPAESVVIEFDFGEELDGVDAATVSITPIGVDPAAALVLTGAPQILGAKVLQRVSAGLDRMSYTIVCTATRGEDIRQLADILRVRVAA